MKNLIFLFIAVFFAQSCAQDYVGKGKVSPYRQSSSGGAAFLFKIDEGFSTKGGGSRIDDRHRLMKKGEVSLLKKMLVDNNLCLDEYNNPSFMITSKQEKIYDVTFANLIEQSYGARPVTPLTYFGKCV